MGNKKNGGIGRGFICAALAGGTLMCYGIAYAIHGDTLVSPYITVGFGAVAGLLLGIVTRRAFGLLTGFASRAVNYATASAVCAGVVLASLYAVNFFCSSASTLHEECVPVERLYTETRHHTKRISRRTYGRGEAYKVYFAEIRFADGRRKSISVRAEQYRRLHVGDTLTLRLEEGALGMAVLTRRGLRLDVHSPRRR